MAVYISLLFSIPVFCGHRLSASDDTLSSSAKMEIARAMHEAGRYSLANKMYIDLINEFHSAPDRVEPDMFQEFVLQHLENLVAMHAYDNASELIGAPVQYTPEGQVRHTVLLSRLARYVPQDRSWDGILPWLYHADSTACALKAAGYDTRCLELSLLNEMGAVYGWLGNIEGLLVAIKRIQSLESFDPSSREWPSDAYLQFGFYLMSTGQLQEAKGIFISVLTNKVLYDLTHLYEPFIPYVVLCRLTGDSDAAVKVMDILLDIIDVGMSQQGVMMSGRQFVHYFRENLYLDMMSFVSEYFPDECSGVFYDAVLTLNNLRYGVRMDMLSYCDTCRSESFRKIYNISGLSSGISSTDMLIDYAYAENIMSGTAGGKLPVRSHRYSWRDVQLALDKDDASVEFVQVSIGEPYFAALVIRNWYDRPEYVRLCSTSDLEAECGGGVDLYRNRGEEVYEMIWKPLEPYLKDAEDIYYSPSGIMRTINMDAIPSPDDGGLMSDRFNMVLLSSTARLADKERSPMSDESILPDSCRVLMYGGLDYYPDPDEWREAVAPWKKYAGSPNYMFDRSVFHLEKLFDSGPDDVGTDIGYLENSYTEVTEIMETVGPSKVLLRTGVDGVEEDFRYDHDAGIIHIATHAFYCSEQEIAEDGRLAEVDFIPVSTNEASAMNRCGLVFSGAGSSAEGNKPEGVCDGFVYGADISARDFRNAGLVVLSGCKTASGDVYSDGIYGLQRAFRYAGAGALIMSLWNVNDRSAALMMTSFYRFLMNGDSRHEAFRKARAAVREEFEDPYYWAAFIMLD